MMLKEMKLTPKCNRKIIKAVKEQMKRHVIKIHGQVKLTLTLSDHHHNNHNKQLITTLNVITIIIITAVPMRIIPIQSYSHAALLLRRLSRRTSSPSIRITALQIV